MYCELADLEVPKMTEEKVTENRWLVISELMERMCDIYWRVKERSNIVQTSVFIRLEVGTS